LRVHEQLALETPASTAPAWGDDAIEITVYGTPAPQGSKRAFAVRGKGGVPTGRIAVIESSHDRVKSWRQAVIDAAREVMAPSWQRDRFPLAGPLEVAVTFYLKRPKSHYRTGRNAELLRDDAPPYPAKAPDLSKLARSTEDALSDAGLWADDAQVVRYARLAKCWCATSFITPGAFIRVREATPITVAITETDKEQP
jgi:Holliday junction resolvase RusA-like endonuclease